MLWDSSFIYWPGIYLKITINNDKNFKKLIFYLYKVQSVAIVNYERIKRTTRLYFVCGLRAVNLLYKQSQVLKRLGLRLTAPPDAESVEKAFDKHMEEVENLRKKMAEEEKKLIKDLVKNIEQKLAPHKTTAVVFFLFLNP
jgi:alanyl-tRNA synthetase